MSRRSTPSSEEDVPGGRHAGLSERLSKHEAPLSAGVRRTPNQSPLVTPRALREALEAAGVYVPAAWVPPPMLPPLVQVNLMSMAFWTLPKLTHASLGAYTPLRCQVRRPVRIPSREPSDRIAFRRLPAYEIDRLLATRPNRERPGRLFVHPPLSFATAHPFTATTFPARTWACPQRSRWPTSSRRTRGHTSRRRRR